MDEEQHYGFNLLDLRADDIDNIITWASEAVTSSEEFINGNDPRVNRHFYRDMTLIDHDSSVLKKKAKDANDVSDWLRDLNKEGRKTDQENKERKIKIEEVDPEVDKGGGMYGKPLKTAIGGIGSSIITGNNAISGIDYKITPEAWDNLTPGEKEIFIEKLKEAGFTDEEIKKIKNGEMSVPKFTIERIATSLENYYKKDPSIRQRIIDLYGIDVFNDDGTVNRDKLAMILLLDQKSLDDKFDIEKLISELGVNHGLETGPPIADQNYRKDPSIDNQQGATTIEGENGNTGNVEKTVDDIVGSGSVAQGTLNADNAAEEIAEVISTEQEKNLSGLLGDLAGSARRIGNAVTPSTGKIETNNSSAGIIAGAGLAAAGAIGGGGAYAHHNLMHLTFTADDFFDLPDEEQNAIVRDMRTSGYTEEDIAKFKESDFGVEDSFISDIAKAVKKSVEINEAVKERIRDKYGFDLLDAVKRASKYKIFATALIDGKNASDDFNIYNILNPVLSETDLTNLTYFGLIMEEVILTEEVAKKMGILEKLGRSYKFTQADYESQDDYTKSAIVSTLTAAGLNSEDIEKMKSSTFRVKVAKMNPIIEILEKINEEQSNFAQKLTDLYKFSLIDAAGKVDKYRLFVAMIIDGESMTDDYNIYRIITETTKDEKTNNPEYNGLKIEDVISEKETVMDDAMNDANNLGQLAIPNEELEEEKIGVAEAAVQDMRNS